MKRKSIFTFCAIALMLVLSLSVLTACNKDGKHKEYTITFDSKGGSAVQPIKASAGAVITAARHSLLIRPHWKTALCSET